MIHFIINLVLAYFGIGILFAAIYAGTYMSSVREALDRVEDLFMILMQGPVLIFKGAVIAIEKENTKGLQYEEEERARKSLIEKILERQNEVIKYRVRVLKEANEILQKENEALKLQLSVSKPKTQKKKSRVRA
jgi:hypothetical protein